MDSQSEEISSVFERFRQYLMSNDIEPLLNEFNHYRCTWSTNKFRMFLINALVVMKTWASSQQQSIINSPNEDWDIEETTPTNRTIADQMQNSGYHLFLAIVDYLRSDRMSTDVEFDIWKRILTNQWMLNEKFYIHLFNKNVSLPTRLIRCLHNDMYDFYVATSRWSSETKILLIQLGFVHLLIHDNVFLGCNHILVAHTLFTLDDYLALIQFTQTNSSIDQKRLITSMNTPEKIQIFLNYHPNADLTAFTSGNSELYQQRTPLTIFDRLLKMDIFYYETNDQMPSVDTPKFSSDQTQTRTATMLGLFQKLICNRAKLSIPLDTVYYQNHRTPLYASTLGFYLLSIVRYRDTFVIPSTEPADDSENDILPNSLIPIKTMSFVNPTYLDSMNKNYIYYLIKRSSTFSPVFRSFFFHHLNLACSFLHQIDFGKHVNSINNARLRSLYDEVVEKRSFLTLKQRCRLLIKESIHQYPSDIKRLVQLPVTLHYYLSFDFLHPNFVPMTLEKLSQVNGRIKPSFFDELQFHEHGLEQINGHNDWEDQLPEDMDEENEDENDEEPDYDDEDGDFFDEEGLYSDVDEQEEDEW